MRKLRPHSNRPETLELLQRPARRRAVATATTSSSSPTCSSSRWPTSRRRPPYNQPSGPARLRLAEPARLDGDELEAHYRHTLETLGNEPGMLGHDLPQGAEQDPGPGQAAPPDRRPDRPRAVVVDATPTSRATPTRGCSRRTRRTPRAAPGQYFTPRPLIRPSST